MKKLISKQLSTWTYKLQNTIEGLSNLFHSEKATTTLRESINDSFQSTFILVFSVFLATSIIGDH